MEMTVIKTNIAKVSRIEGAHNGAVSVAIIISIISESIS